MMKIVYKITLSVSLACLTTQIAQPNEHKKKYDTLCFTYQIRRRQQERYQSDTNWQHLLKQTQELIHQNPSIGLPSIVVPEYIQFMAKIHRDGSFTRTVKVTRKNFEQLQKPYTRYARDADAIILQFSLHTISKRVQSQALEYFKSDRQKICEYLTLLFACSQSELKMNGVQPYLAINIFTNPESDSEVGGFCGSDSDGSSMS